MTLFWWSGNAKDTFLTIPDVKKLILKDKFVVVWKYAQMH